MVRGAVAGGKDMKLNPPMNFVILFHMMKERRKKTIAKEIQNNFANRFIVFL